MAVSTHGVYPDREALIALRLQARNLPLYQLHQAQSVIAGRSRAPFRGRGMDYLESRHYQPGDDVRTMDWRVTARSGRAHVKVYQEERERPVVIMADFGPGMFFATEGAFKSIIAARAAALLAWSTVGNGDRIGALLYSERHHELRPVGGKRGALGLIHALVNAADPDTRSRQKAGPGHFNAALLRLRRVARPGSMVFMLSDFHHFDSDSKRHLQLLRRHNDIVACQVLDRLELQPPAPGHYPLCHGEQQRMLDAGSQAQRAAWTQYFSERRRGLDTLMRQCAIPLIRLHTGDDVAASLRRALVRPHAAPTGYAA